MYHLTQEQILLSFSNCHHPSMPLFPIPDTNEMDKFRETVYKSYCVIINYQWPMISKHSKCLSKFSLILPDIAICFVVVDNIVAWLTFFWPLISWSTVLLCWRVVPLVNDWVWDSLPAYLENVAYFLMYFFGSSLKSLGTKSNSPTSLSVLYDGGLGAG